MTTKDTPLHELLFPLGMPEDVRGKILPRNSLTAYLPNIGADVVTALETDIKNTTDSIFKMTPMDILLEGWKSYREVARALEESRKKPGDAVFKPLVKHTVKSTHRPYVEIILDDKSVGKIQFQLDISLTVESASLKIQNGELVSILTGSCQGTIKLSLAGETLAEVKTSRIELPGKFNMQTANIELPRKSDPIKARLMGLNGDYLGQTFMLADGQVIGRSPSSSIHIEDRSASHQHARIRSAASRWFIQDMGSAIGIFVNNKKVDAAPLSNGDRIRIGGTEFEFHA